MLTEEEKKFIDYWEINRQKNSRFFRKILLGGPWGLIFALPILLAVLFDDWYKRMIPVSVSMLIMIMVCVIGIAVFYAYFRQQMRFDRNEQLYKELKIKEQRQDNL
jgi:glucan phosphoethanolaminetransferase (alkaline phosphatase superfamily)